jgi:Zn-dependent protease with chaperone function
MMTWLGRQMRFVAITALGVGQALLVLVAAAMLVHVWRNGMPHLPWPAHLVPSTLLSWAAVGSSRSVLVAARQLRDTRRLRSWIQTLRVPTSAAVLQAASVAGVAGVIEVIDPAPYAFTIGFRRPRVVVSQGLVAMLTTEELTAVLVHEREHVEGLDPLRLLVVRMYSEPLSGTRAPALAALLPCKRLPALAALLRWRVDRRELVADRRAAHACGRKAMVRALYVAVHQPPGTTAAASSPRLLEARLIHLETGNPRPLPPVTRAQLVASLPSLSVFGLLVVLHVILSVADQLA